MQISAGMAMNVSEDLIGFDDGAGLDAAQRLDLANDTAQPPLDCPEYSPEAEKILEARPT